MGIKALFGRDMVRLWTRDLVITVAAVFFMRFGEGLINGARMNFFMDTLSISSRQVMLLEGVREVPGLILIFLAALTMRMPLAYRAAMATLILGLGFFLESFVMSYAGLVAMAVAASFGLHLFQPISPALGLALATERTRGRVLGMLASVGGLATIGGGLALTLTSNISENVDLRLFFRVGGVIIMASALIFWRLSKNLGATRVAQPRLVVRKRYWRFYVLKFFEGSRKEVLGSFCTLMLVDSFGWKITQTSQLLMAASVISFLLSPSLGAVVDRFGSRMALIAGYTILLAGAVIYATVPNAWVLAGTYLVLRLGLVLNLGLNVYVHEEAPSEELNPTLAAGVSFDHISSVGMPFIYGALLPVIGYSGVYWIAAAVILVSVAFVVTLHPHPKPGAGLELAPAR